MQRVEVQLEDDLTGGPADETVEFGIDGRTYALDLNARHAAEFRRQMSRFVEHARPVRSRTRGPVRTAASRERSRQIRAWAEEQGLEVAEYGRLPGNIVHQYETESHNGSQAASRRARRGPARSKSSARRRPHLSGVSNAQTVVVACRMCRSGTLPRAPQGRAGRRVECRRSGG